MLNDVIDNDVTDNDVIDSWMNMHKLLASRPNVVVSTHARPLDALGVNGALDLRSRGCGFNSQPFSFHVITLGNCSHTCACVTNSIISYSPIGSDAMWLGR